MTDEYLLSILRGEPGDKSTLIVSRAFAHATADRIEALREELESTRQWIETRRLEASSAGDAGLAMDLRDRRNSIAASLRGAEGGDRK